MRFIQASLVLWRKIELTKENSRGGVGELFFVFYESSIGGSIAEKYCCHRFSCCSLALLFINVSKMGEMAG